MVFALAHVRGAARESPGVRFEVAALQNRVVDDRDVAQRGILEKQFGTPETGALVPARGDLGGRFGGGGTCERPAQHHVHDDHVGPVGAEVHKSLPELLLGDQGVDARRRECAVQLVLQQVLLEVVVLDDDDERIHGCPLDVTRAER